jgi:hypothetical protein
VKNIVEGSNLSAFMRPIGGLDEFNPPEFIADDGMQRCKNVVLYEGVVRKMYGRRLFSDETFAEKCNGMYEYIDAASTHHIIVAVGTSLYKLTSTTKTVIDTVPNEDLNFETTNGYLYYTGLTTMRKYDGVNNVASDVGITAPTVAPTVAEGAATGLTGSYAYVYTWVIEESGVKTFESNPSPVSATITPSNKKITVTPSASADTRITHRYIYRTLASGSEYFYDGKIANNTPAATFTSSQADTLLGDIVKYNRGKPGQYQYLAICNGRMFWAKGVYLYWSELSNSDSAIEAVRVDRATGLNLNVRKVTSSGAITGLKGKYNQNTGVNDLYVFTESNVLVLPGGDPYAKEYILTSTYGCYNQDSIVEYCNYLIFYTTKNNFCFILNGQIFDFSTYSIDETQEDIVGKTLVHCSIIDNHYLYATCRTDTGKTYNHLTLVCDLKTGVQVNEIAYKAAWTTNERNAHNYINSSINGKLYYDDVDFVVYKIDSSYENEEVKAGGSYTPIESSFRSKNFGGLDLFYTKHPEIMRILGNFSAELQVFVFYSSLQKADNSKTTGESKSSLFGVARFGEGTFSSIGELVECECGMQSSGSKMFSFEFKSSVDDIRFQFKGYQFTQQINKDHN